jgi:hypothetical protein
VWRGKVVSLGKNSGVVRDFHHVAKQCLLTITLSIESTERWSALLQHIESINVIAMLERRTEDSKNPGFQKLLKVDSWEVPVLEVVWSEIRPQINE